MGSALSIEDEEKQKGELKLENEETDGKESPKGKSPPVVPLDPESLAKLPPVVEVGSIPLVKIVAHEDDYIPLSEGSLPKPRVINAKEEICPDAVAAKESGSTMASEKDTEKTKNTPVPSNATETKLPQAEARVAEKISKRSGEDKQETAGTSKAAPLSVLPPTSKPKEEAIASPAGIENVLKKESLGRLVTSEGKTSTATVSSTDRTGSVEKVTPLVKKISAEKMVLPKKKESAERTLPPGKRGSTEMMVPPGTTGSKEKLLIPGKKSAEKITAPHKNLSKEKHSHMSTARLPVVPNVSVGTEGAHKESTVRGSKEKNGSKERSGSKERVGLKKKFDAILSSARLPRIPRRKGSKEKPTSGSHEKADFAMNTPGLPIIRKRGSKEKVVTRGRASRGSKEKLNSLEKTAGPGVIARHGGSREKLSDLRKLRKGRPPTQGPNKISATSKSSTSVSSAISTTGQKSATSTNSLQKSPEQKSSVHTARFGGSRLLGLGKHQKLHSKEKKKK